NLDCKPEMLEQFAVMGSVYMKNIHGIASPRVGLANNGAEETKGTELYIETHKLLKQNAKINFVGNVEGRGLPLGECDVAVADGFTGNMILKTYEGAGKMISDEVKNIFTRNIITKIGALFVMKGIKEFRKRMDYKEIGGAMLLGISKPVIKAHGSSDEKGFFNSIRQAVNLVKTDVIPQIEAAMEKEETNA
ncbi:MAG: phosphate--acyl-ACP acyltransferase, partial [Clostridia bacterium]|nr:phosphate--acyl-ACP acyltransferase [Clostridia bacterium]